MRTRRLEALLTFALALSITCSGTSSSPAPTLQQIIAGNDVDLLLVVDNSASIGDAQAVFGATLPHLVQALDALPTGRPSLHIGVVDTTVDINTQGYSNGASGCPSPDPADDGVLQNTARVAGCTPPNGRFISDVKNADGTRTTNYAGTLDQAMSCIALVGSSGCGFEAPLEAMKRALDGSRPENAGFLRDNAYLAVVFMTDEDDASVRDPAVFSLPDGMVGGHNDFRVQPLFAYACDQPISATTPGTYTNCKPRTDSAADNYLQTIDFYTSFVASVKDPGLVAVAAIAGPTPGRSTDDTPALSATMNTGGIAIGPITLSGNVQPLALQPSCSATLNGNPAIGRPGVRMRSFVDGFDANGRFYDVCQPDYSAALVDVVKTLSQTMSSCIQGAIATTDADASNPGTQLPCTVADVTGYRTASEASTPIPACKMIDAATPADGQSLCWWAQSNPTTCPAPETGYELHFVRTSPPPAGAVTRIQCARA